MAKEIRSQFLQNLQERLGALRKLPDSQSLFESASGRVRVYVRYSKVHGAGETFYGLRARDLQALGGHPAFIAFLWDAQELPLLIPFADFEDVFANIRPASDGQFKTQIYFEHGMAEMYVATAGRFNVQGHWGWDKLMRAAEPLGPAELPLSHSQVQTLLGAIGCRKGYDIWIPSVDRMGLDWSLTDQFQCREELPGGYNEVCEILREVDVVWVGRGSSEVMGLFEVEHSSPIYSGLLRMNDVHLTAPRAQVSFNIVGNEWRGSAFLRQIRRPTFRTSGLSERCSFLKYDDVSAWYRRIIGNT